MLLGECFAGEDAEVLFEAIKSDWSAEDEDTISNLVVWIKQYKQTEVQAVGAEATWNSNLGMYLLTIPAAYVPASGSFDIVVKGSGDIDDVKIRLGVNTGDAALTTLLGGSTTGSGSEKVIPEASITFDASESTITLTSPYNTITVAQVLSIRNITKNMLIYDCAATNRSSISINTGVINYTYSGTMADTDIIQIIVNLA